MVTYNNWNEKPLPRIDVESQQFWEAANERRLEIQHCADCQEYQFYPRTLCRNCWSKKVSFTEIEGTGTIYTYTICHVSGQPGYDDETPYLVAIVELDIPKSNPSGRPVRMTSHIVNCDHEEVTVDMPVSVTFKAVQTDPSISLPVFQPNV